LRYDEIMRHRAPETLADYLVVGICPALIGLLVGSLMWFLVEVFYLGEFKARLIFVMAMFVMGIVCIARISMEFGFERASLFGGPFAAVIALAVVKFASDGLIIAGPLMILVWWATHKLTWDCTLIDDTQDASGQGLLQQMGLDSSAGPADPSPPGTTSRPGDIEAVTVEEAPPPPWWERLFEPDRRPHAPGVWVVYFSLAALPLFGIGGWFVPSSDPVRRARVFGLLVIYVASGMGLLLATSFLGLRKYLRQRKLQMPMEMTSTWIIAGLVLIIGVLLAATILPRPSREYSLSQLPVTISSAARRASRLAFGKEGTKDDKAEQPANTDAKDSQSTERQGDKGQQTSSESGPQESSKGKGSTSGKGDGKSEASSSSESDKSKSSGGGKGKDEKGGGSKNGGKSKQQNAESQADQKSNQDTKSNDSDQQRESSSQPRSQPPPEQAKPKSGDSPQSAQSSPTQVVSKVASFLSQSVMTLFRILFYVGLLLTGLIAAWLYREQLFAAWQKLLAELRELWDRWFGQKKAADEAALSQPLVAPPRTFASYVDPFATGDAARMPWPQLVRYTFQALEAWGREHGCPREIGQTPYEFAVTIASAEPQLSTGVQTLASAYNQLAYARGSAAGNSAESLRELWHLMRAHQAPPVLAGV
jgi:hypothetical protein